MPSQDGPAAGAAPRASVAERYGRPAPGPRRLRTALLVALGVAFTGLVVALALPRLSDPVSFVVRGFDATSDGTVRVDWEVAREPGTTVECQVRARGADGTEVGNELVRVPPAAGRRTVVSHDLTTAARAVTGEVRSCIVVGP